jgi:hypothetical protein
MTRRLILFLITVPIVALASYPLFSNPGSASSDLHLEQGEFWRLPWRTVTNCVSAQGLTMQAECVIFITNERSFLKPNSYSRPRLTECHA